MRLAAALVLVLGVTASATAATPPPTYVPGQLTVGVSLPSEGFQVGVVDGSDVIYAQGLEIDLARALSARLGLATTTFVQSRFDRLFSAGAKPWDLAIAEITITPGRARAVDFSRPYMRVDQGVLASTSLHKLPTAIAGLRALRICALAKSTGADVARQRVVPTTPVRLSGNVPALMLDLQSGRCDAVVYDVPVLATLKARTPQRFGEFIGVIPTSEEYGIALPHGSALLGPVNRALGGLIADGTVERLSKKWLSIDTRRLRVLR